MKVRAILSCARCAISTALCFWLLFCLATPFAFAQGGLDSDDSSQNDPNRPTDLVNLVSGKDTDTGILAKKFGNTKGHPSEIIKGIINVIFGFLGVLAICVILYAGFVWMTSAGEEKKLKKAHGLLINGVIGLAIILSSWTVAYFVLQQIGISATRSGATPSGNSSTAQNILNSISN